MSVHFVYWCACRPGNETMCIDILVCVCVCVLVRKCTRPSPALPYSKRRETGWGPGNKATFVRVLMYVFMCVWLFTLCMCIVCAGLCVLQCLAQLFLLLVNLV